MSRRVERGGEQIVQGGLGLAHEPARDRRAGGRLRRAAHRRADRFQGARLAAGGDPGEHLLHHHRGQLVLGGERLVAGERHLDAAHGARPRPGDLHLAPAEGDRAALLPVPHRGALRVVPALGPDDAGDLLLEHRLHHGHPGRHAQREQSLACRAGDIAEHRGELLGQLGRPRRRVGRLDQAQSRYVLLHGGPSSRMILGRFTRYLPTGRPQVGDRHLRSSTRVGTSSQPSPTVPP